LSDTALREKGYSGIEKIRRYLPQRTSETDFLSIAATRLDEALSLMQQGDRAGAKQMSILAYLEGVEPVEPRLRARDAQFVVEIEQKMARVRSALEGAATPEAVEAQVIEAKRALEDAKNLLAKFDGSPSFTFSVA